jgi:hypothetical protein
MATPLIKQKPPGPVEQFGEHHALITRYSSQLGCPLVVDGNGIFPPANHDVAGLTIPAGLAGEVNTEIVRRSIIVPILAVPGRPCRWVFPVKSPANLSRGLPVGVGLMTGASRIPLPPTEIDGAPVRWIAEPGRGFVNVPSLPLVLSAVRHITSPRTI